MVTGSFAGKGSFPEGGITNYNITIPPKSLYGLAHGASGTAGVDSMKPGGLILSKDSSPSDLIQLSQNPLIMWMVILLVGIIPNNFLFRVKELCN